METKATNAAQHAEQGAERLNLSQLKTLLDTSVFTEDEDGILNRPNIDIAASLSHETEDYLRIIKTLWQILPIYHDALNGTYYNNEKVNERYAVILELLTQAREEIGRDMGVCISDRITEWQDDYL